MDVIRAFWAIQEKFPRAERAAHDISLGFEPEPGVVLRNEIAQRVRETRAHQDLLKFWGEDANLWRTIAGPYAHEARWSELRSELRVLRLYTEIILLRAIFAAGVHSKDKSPENRIEQFADFLASPNVTRRVDVPLFHLELTREFCDLGDLGILRNAEPRDSTNIPDDILEGLESVPRCLLTFTVKTEHFLGVGDFPLVELLKRRIGLLRLAVSPLIAYNHFTVEHAKPWELRIREDAFLGRHWSRDTSTKLNVKRHLFTDADAERVKALRELFDRMRWERPSPWRLAMDRLDDAVFKLECASPDAVLDIAIGLESVFIESDSRQESTHKVAIRVARFLEDVFPLRRELFRAMKQIYKSRSILAHGQEWRLKPDGVSQVERAALILTRTLRRMVELQCTELDHLALDLS